MIIIILLLIVDHVVVAMLTGLELMQTSVDVRRQAAKAENVTAGKVSNKRLKTERKSSRKKLQQGKGGEARVICYRPEIDRIG
jgi:hypothetical protein